MSEQEGWRDRPWEAEAEAGGEKKATSPISGCGLGCGGLMFLVVVLILIGAFSGDDGPDDPTNFDAQYYCEDFVKDRLRAPSTADFTGTTATGGPVTWSVRGAVDSENGFGAAIRSNFTCQLRYDSTEESWTLVSLTGLG